MILTKPHKWLKTLLFVYLLLMCKQLWALDYVIVIDSPYTPYGNFEKSFKQSDRNDLKKMLNHLGYELVYLEPNSINELLNIAKEKLPTDANIKSIIFSGHSNEDVYQFSQNEILTADSIQKAAMDLFTYFNTPPEVDLYISGCLSACETTPKRSSLTTKVTNLLWSSLQIELPKRIKKLTVIGHLSTTEARRYKRNILVDHLLKNIFTKKITGFNIKLAHKFKTNPMFLELIPMVVGILSPITKLFVDIPDIALVYSFAGGIAASFLLRFSALLESKRVEVHVMTPEGRRKMEGSIYSLYTQSLGEPQICEAFLENNN